DLSIELTTFTDGVGGTAARVTAGPFDGVTGKGLNVTLQIDMSDFSPPNLPNGGTAPFYNDRIIAHEMVHAVMNRSINVLSMTGAADQTWFLEGTAEFIHGADERLSTDIAASSTAAVVAQSVNFGSAGAAWGGTSAEYSSAYAAIGYLHQEIKNNGGSGIKDVTVYLNQNVGSTLDAALAAVSPYANEAAFLADYQTNGAAYISGLNLTDADTGAIGGTIDGGAVKTAENVIPNSSSRSGSNPLSGFNETFEDVAIAAVGNNKILQVGANKDETLDVSFGAVNTAALSIQNVDLVNNAGFATFQMDLALNQINLERSKIGAQLNRLESTITNNQVSSETTTASRSRIRDADFAAETATLTKTQILQQAATAIIAQANSSPRLLVSLLT
ncbi:MAG: flagellinolysin, partial [Betaproteobacteria bacterium]|nr:flagellinolysin [Betaproteobacteria bacterium]